MVSLLVYGQIFNISGAVLCATVLSTYPVSCVNIMTQITKCICRLHTGTGMLELLFCDVKPHLRKAKLLVTWYRQVIKNV